MRIFVLFCFVLFCFVLFCFVLFCFVLFCFVLFCLLFILHSLLFVGLLCSPFCAYHFDEFQSVELVEEYNIRSCLKHKAKEVREVIEAAFDAR